MKNDYVGYEKPATIISLFLIISPIILWTEILLISIYLKDNNNSIDVIMFLITTLPVSIVYTFVMFNTIISDIRKRKEYKKIGGF